MMSKIFWHDFNVITPIHSGHYLVVCDGRVWVAYWDGEAFDRVGKIKWWAHRPQELWMLQDLYF